MDTLSSLSSKIAAAEIAQKKWRTTFLDERIKLIMRVHAAIAKQKEKFVKILIDEIYKPRVYAVDEVERTIDMIAAFCEASRNLAGEVRESGEKTAIVKRQPLGTVLCISPFNYPLNESIAKIVPAILMGNSVIFKPSSVGGGVGKLIAKIFSDAEFPEGVFSLIEILSNTIKYYPILTNTNKNKFEAQIDMIDYVVSHPLIDAINFTGSTKTAEHITKIAGIKKLVMGLSGKDASIVFNDADTKLAASEIVSGAFSYSGQRCTGIKRVLVQNGVYDELIKNLKFQISNSLIAGDLNDEKTNFGPVISQEHANFVNELLSDAENLGAKISRFQIPNSKFSQNKWGSRYILPTIIEEVIPSMRIAWEEPFGPILPIMRFSEAPEAVRLCNQSSFGLQNSIFTTNIHTAFEVAESLECGVIQINGKDARGPDNFPFLGVKKSGLGVVGGISYLLHEMSAIKSIVIN